MRKWLVYLLLTFFALLMVCPSVTAEETCEHNQTTEIVDPAACVNPGETGQTVCSVCGEILEYDEETEMDPEAHAWGTETFSIMQIENDERFAIDESGTITDYFGTDTELVIPGTINGIKVMSIGDYAFSECISLTAITIPDGVTSIGGYAFNWCINLTAITIPDSVTSIGEYAFYCCGGFTSITIPDSVTTIGKAAFRSCSNLTSITIPDSATSIGDYAFESCSSLTTITIPDSVTSIGEGAFDGVKDYAVKVTCGTYVDQWCEANGVKADVDHAAMTVTTEAVASTCTEIGLTEGKHCSACGKVIVKQEVIPALGHDEGTWVVVTEATTTSEGLKERRCTVCQFVLESEVIDKLEEEDTKVPGDVNGDGVIDGRDLLRLARYIGGHSVDIIKENASVNGDSVIDGRDLLRLARYVGGHSVELI